MLSLPRAYRINKNDLFIPAMDDAAWHRFIVEIGAYEFYARDETENYETVITSFGIKYGGYVLLDYAGKTQKITSEGESILGGYVFRFKNKQNKLAFQLKWS